MQSGVRTNSAVNSSRTESRTPPCDGTPPHIQHANLTELSNGKMSQWYEQVMALGNNSFSLRNQDIQELHPNDTQLLSSASHQGLSRSLQLQRENFWFTDARCPRP